MRQAGALFIAVRGPLTLAASLLAEHRLQTRRLSNCGARAWLLRGMWDLPRPGLEPVSPALAGRFSTTAPPGKPRNLPFNRIFTLPLLGSFQSLDVQDCQTLAEALTVFSRVKQALLKPGSHRGSREKRQGEVAGAAPHPPVSLSTAESLIKIRPAAGEPVTSRPLVCRGLA